MSHSYFLDHSVHLKETVPLKQRMKAYFDIDRCLVNFKISKRKYQLYLRVDICEVLRIVLFGYLDQVRPHWMQRHTTLHAGQRFVETARPQARMAISRGWHFPPGQNLRTGYLPRRATSTPALPSVHMSERHTCVINIRVQNRDAVTRQAWFRVLPAGSTRRGVLSAPQKGQVHWLKFVFRDFSFTSRKLNYGINRFFPFALSAEKLITDPVPSILPYSRHQFTGTTLFFMFCTFDFNTYLFLGLLFSLKDLEPFRGNGVAVWVAGSDAWPRGEVAHQKLVLLYGLILLQSQTGTTVHTYCVLSILF